jgi:TRAP-type C4-dicarboxylate transport system permease small subunit
MSDRGFLFLFSLLMIAAGGASVAYLVATGQAGTVDGLFLTLTALLLTVCFALYVIYVIHRAMEAAKPTAPAAKAAATPSPAKAAPAQS